MTDPELTTDALRRFRERVGHLTEQIVTDEEALPWADVIYQEAAFLVEEGPAAYVKYVRRMDEAALRAFLDSHPEAVRAYLDRELDRILGRDDA
ncbi:hypothetical protein [Actinoallomurus sp. CA-150999]|uniref:hypothetical protein n=1 Tax=Actinoallomurus sp. CA-150999 TaxID=3239887 RepID=UPI003D8B5987